MPKAIVDDFAAGEAREVEMGWGELPPFAVVAMAEQGDSEAQAWLDAHPTQTAHLPGQHNQKDHGRRGGGGGGVIERTRELGGVTIRPATGREPTSGFIVARQEGSRIVDEADFFGDRERAVDLVDGYLAEHADALSEPGTMLGVWHDKAHGEVVLDVVEQVDDQATAERLGRERDQQSIWDVTNGAEIPTGGTGGREGSLDGRREGRDGAGEAAEAGERDEPGRAAGVRRVGRRRSAIAREVEVARRLFKRLSSIRRDAGRQLLAAAEVAFAEAVRAAGVRASNKARNRRGQAMAAAVAASHAEGNGLRPFFGTLSMTENELLAGAFESFAERAEGWLRDLRADQRKALNDVGYPGEAAFSVAEDDAAAKRGAEYLSAALMALARGRIIAGRDTVNLDGPGEVSGAIPAHLVVQALDVAEGSLVATLAETADELPSVHPARVAATDRVQSWYVRIGDQVSHDELQKRLVSAADEEVLTNLAGAEAGEALALDRERLEAVVDVEVDPAEARRQVDNGERIIRDAMAEAQQVMTDGAPGIVPYIWVHGFYGTPRTDFPPHANQCNGVVTTNPETDERFRNPGGPTAWPGEFFSPGDHNGCTCELVPQVDTRVAQEAEVGIRAVLDRARKKIEQEFGVEAARDLRRIAPRARRR